MRNRVLLAVGIVLLLFIPMSRMMTEHTDEEGVIGHILIPKLELELAIYEGVSEEVLEKGVGHIEESSYPGNNEGTHCLLAGHRGLPSAKLFAELGEMQIGDLFYIDMPECRYVYKICEIQVIKPEETEKLKVQGNRELVSLITCTPYGINTHRLVVTGERMK